MEIMLSICLIIIGILSAGYIKQTNLAKNLTNDNSELREMILLLKDKLKSKLREFQRLEGQYNENIKRICLLTEQLEKRISPFPYILKVDATKDTIFEALGISSERASELAHLVMQNLRILYESKQQEDGTVIITTVAEIYAEVCKLAQSFEEFAFLCAFATDYTKCEGDNIVFPYPFESNN